MSTDSNAVSESQPEARSPRRPGLDVFLVSLLILFLELACIRWFPAHVMLLTFFTNTVLLASFLGMSLGCLAARHSRNYLFWTPYLLGLALAGGILMESFQNAFNVDIGTHQSTQVIYFGAEYQNRDRVFPLPMEILAGFFFTLIALAMVGPGQELGRALQRVPSRIQAYTLNILGSIVGIVLFAAFSWLQLGPFWWFLPIVVMIGWFLSRLPGQDSVRRAWPRWVTLGLILFLASRTSGREDGETVFIEHWWSPYYRIDLLLSKETDRDKPIEHTIVVNQIGHQHMQSRRHGQFVYALPHLLNRDTGGKRFRDILIIGAGSGNDVSRALQWGDPEARIDAVEIDPKIQELGIKHHPDEPYSNVRVNKVVQDGRNFLRSTDRKYDLIVLALVDSLVLHSGYSNLRLENYLFTQQAFQDVRSRLKDDGLFVMYNYFRRAWLVARLKQQLDNVFGQDNSICMPLPLRESIDPDEDKEDERQKSLGGYTFFLAGNTAPIRQLLARGGEYWLPFDRPTGPDDPGGFDTKPTDREKKDAEKWQRLGLCEVKPPKEPLRTATDDWPFLYNRNMTIPLRPTLSGVAVMGALAIILLIAFMRMGQTSSQGWSFDACMFFLGAGFMLIETKAVVNMALLFGSTWMVNTVVFFAVLVMILLANLFVLWFKPQVTWPYYLGLGVSLALNLLISLEAFLGMNPAVQVMLSCLLVFAPILFAGVIFAVIFSRSAEPDQAFGANIAGAMMGGLAENTSVIFTFQGLIVVAAVFYALSLVRWRPAIAPTTAALQPPETQFPEEVNPKRE